MLVSAHPTIRLHLQAHFDTKSLPTHISATYTVPTSTSPSTSLIFHYPVFWGNVPSHPYTSSSIHAFDEAGPVPFTFTKPDESHIQQWLPSRPLQGQALTLKLDVFPRKVDRSTPTGSRIDLRHDHEGLVGVGRWFLPIPGYTTVNRSTEHDDMELLFTNILTWDLSLCPSGTRAVCTYGEGPGPIVQVGNRYTCLDSVFMLGPVKSHPPPTSGSSISQCTTYWLAPSLPDNLCRTIDFNAALFRNMVRMFGLDEDKTSYRVFLRNVVRSYGGSGMRGSFVLDYSDDSEELEDHELKFMFAHEMTHGFVALFPEEDGEPNIWFADGLADWYACVLPYRFGIEDQSYALNALNLELSGYYTSPMIHVPMKDALSGFYQGWYAGKVAYFRGFAYLAAIDHRLRHIAGIEHPQQPGPLDDIVTKLGNRMRNGENVVQKDWLEALNEWLPNRFDSREELRKMLSGEVVVSLKDAYFLSPEQAFEGTKQRILQFGFNHAAANGGVVKQVDAGSEAEKAGLQVGDQIVRCSRADDCYGDPHQTFWVDVLGGMETVTRRIEWLPRAAVDVTVWETTRPRNNP
ncbi:peptidase M61 domain-containing protein [Sarocladium implicatum]|nr:peptidase M61 domain-containing protein [Sarocladium implicatum]